MKGQCVWSLETMAAWNSQTKDCKHDSIFSLVSSVLATGSTLTCERSHPEFHRGSSWRPPRPRMSHCSPTSSTTCVTSGRRTSWRRPDRREEMDHRLQLKLSFLFIFTVEKWIRVFGNCLCDWEQAHVFNRTFYTICWYYLFRHVGKGSIAYHCWTAQWGEGFVQLQIARKLLELI